MHYIAIKITQITVFYMTKDCYLRNFNRNIVHLLVLLNKYVKNARCNNQRYQLHVSAFMAIVRLDSMSKEKLHNTILYGTNIILV